MVKLSLNRHITRRGVVKRNPTSLFRAPQIGDRIQLTDDIGKAQKGDTGRIIDKWRRGESHLESRPEWNLRYLVVMDKDGSRVRITEERITDFIVIEKRKKRQRRK